MNELIVTLVSTVANMSLKLSDLQDTKQKYEIMCHYYRNHEVISSNFIFLNTLFLNKDKNEEIIESIKNKY